MNRDVIAGEILRLAGSVSMDSADRIRDLVLQARTAGAGSASSVPGGVEQGRGSPAPAVSSGSIGSPAAAESASHASETTTGKPPRPVSLEHVVLTKLAELDAAVSRVREEADQQDANLQVAIEQAAALAVRLAQAETTIKAAWDNDAKGHRWNEHRISAVEKRVAALEGKSAESCMTVAHPQEKLVLNISGSDKPPYVVASLARVEQIVREALAARATGIDIAHMHGTLLGETHGKLSADQVAARANENTVEGASSYRKADVGGSPPSLSPSTASPAREVPSWVPSPDDIAELSPVHHPTGTSAWWRYFCSALRELIASRAPRPFDHDLDYKDVCDAAERAFKRYWAASVDMVNGPNAEVLNVFLSRMREEIRFTCTTIERERAPRPSPQPSVEEMRDALTALVRADDLLGFPTRAEWSRAKAALSALPASEATKPDPMCAYPGCTYTASKDWPTCHKHVTWNPQVPLHPVSRAGETPSYDKLTESERGIEATSVRSFMDALSAYDVGLVTLDDLEAGYRTELRSIMLASRAPSPSVAAPVAWRVHRAVDYESREYFHTEKEARENARLGVCDAYVTPLYEAPSPSPALACALKGCHRDAVPKHAHCLQHESELMLECGRLTNGLTASDVRAVLRQDAQSYDDDAIANALNERLLQRRHPHSSPALVALVEACERWASCDGNDLIEMHHRGTLPDSGYSDNVKRLVPLIVAARSSLKPNAPDAQKDGAA